MLLVPLEFPSDVLTPPATLPMVVKASVPLLTVVGPV